MVDRKRFPSKEAKNQPSVIAHSSSRCCEPVPLLPRGLRHFVKIGGIFAKESEEHSSSNEQSVGGEVDGRVPNPNEHKAEQKPVAHPVEFL